MAAADAAGLGALRQQAGDSDRSRPAAAPRLATHGGSSHRQVNPPVPTLLFTSYWIIVSFLYIIRG